VDRVDGIVELRGKEEYKRVLLPRIRGVS